jgi:3-oxoacyl-[acyl-carrier-protein] synthase-3
MTVSILGTGSYLPSRVLTNKDLEQMVDTTDDWIKTRTGIQERRIADESQATSDLALEAAKKALADAQIEPQELDAIIVGTITPDWAFPATACLVQRGLRITGIPCFDIEAACSSFIYGLYIASQFIETGTHKLILVIAADALSKITDWQDRSTCVLLGDGAGAAVLGKGNGRREIITSYLGANGSMAEILYQPAGGSRLPPTKEVLDKRLHYLKMQGREVYKYAIPAMERATREVIAQAKLKIEDISLLIPHQANVRIIKMVGERLGLDCSRVFLNIQKYGNTSGASVGIALDEVLREKRVKKGEIIVLTAFGAGLTWGAMVIRE